MFTGACPSGAGSTFPLILKMFVLVLVVASKEPLIAFEVIVTLLLIAPGRFVSYFTLITPFAPGAIGSFGYSGTVQPQEA